MTSIISQNIDGRADWFHAATTVDGRVYEAFEASRHAAFMEVVRQLMLKHLINW